ncbi:MAG: transglycosylase family protein [Candidatus Saccharimonadales bacterium]
MEKAKDQRIAGIGETNIKRRSALRAGAFILTLGLGGGALVAGSAAGESATDAKRSPETFYFNKYHYSGFVLPKHFERLDEQNKLAGATSTTTTTTTTRVESREVSSGSHTYNSSGADVNWDGIARCETGGNWSMQGPSYSGGLGFYNGTWNGFGGQEFAPNAGQASREEQIVVAERVYAKFGLSGWGCRAYG